MTQQPLMKPVAIPAIRIGATNPRKTFDEDAINELAISVKRKGVIQAIVLRYTDTEGVYELVCGERRVRASNLAGLTEIPAYILELTDEEALELQIIENLQRKDVHPLEEAFSFKQMLEKFSIEETAAKVGKKEYFIRQRMKLNDLTPEWQKLFYKNLIPVSDALKISMLPVDSQESLLESAHINEENIHTYSEQIKINQYQFNRSIGDLTKAPFDLSSIDLDKKAGACINCRFNSASANLFPEDAEKPICNNISCFSNKCDLHFEIECKNAIEDLTITLISDSYILDKKVVEKYAKLGRDVLSTNQYDKVEEDLDKPDWEEFKDENEGDTEEELREYFERVVAQYEDELREIQEKISSGNCIKAFYVDGNCKGKYTYIELTKKGNNGQSPKTNGSNGIPGVSEIDFEINKIKDREKRAKELDAEKVHKKIIDALKQDAGIKKMPSEFSYNDRAIMCFLLQEHISYQTRDFLKKAVGLSPTYDASDPEKNFIALEAITDEQLSLMVRTIILDRNVSSTPRNNGGYMLRKMAEDLGTIPIEAYETEQKEKADKRQHRVNDRISELQEQKKQLTAKPEAKANSKAKSIKKAASK